MISIGSAEQVDELRDRLTSELQAFRAEGVEVQIRTISRGTLTFLGCEFAGRRLNGQETNRRFRLSIANAISDLIINSWEERYMRKLIRSRYGYIDEPEQEVIFQYALKNLYSPPGKEHPLQQRIRRKGAVLSRLTEFLDKHNELVIDGFITFRLREYVEELEDAVETAVEEFLAEKEEQEFVQLLKCFVEMQEPQVERLNIWPEKGGTFHLTDASNNPVNNKELDGLMHELGEQGINQEDLLVSALVALSPHHLKVHHYERMGHDIIGLLKEVFGSRLTLCDGCSQCRR